MTWQWQLRLCILSNDTVRMGSTVVEFVNLVFDTQNFDPSCKQSLESLVLKVVNSCGLATQDELKADNVKVKLEVADPGQSATGKPVGAVAASMCTTVRYISEFCDNSADDASKDLMRIIKNISHLKLLTQFLTFSLYEWTFVDCKAVSGVGSVWHMGDISDCLHIFDETHAFL